MEAELSKALGLCEQIPGALSQPPQTPQVEVVDERPLEEREPDVATDERDAAADGRSSDSGGPLTTAQQSQQQVNAQLQGEKEALEQRLAGMMALLQQSLQQTASAAGARAPPSAGNPASRPVSHIDVLKSVNDFSL